VLTPSLSQPFALRARWVFPIDRPPIDGGIVTIAGGRIVAVGENTSGQPPLDLGDVALLPGLINTHTHLEFSKLEQPLGRAGMGFAAWVERVVAWRREQGAGSQGSGVGAGLAESAKAGVVALGEIAMPGCPLESYDSPASVAVVALLELLSRSAERVQPLMDLAEQHVAALHGAGSNVTAGLSPHATYSVHPELLWRACELSAAERVPLAMHVAESREELELLELHTGLLVDLLKSLGVWEPNERPRGARPLDFLRTLATAHRVLVIHGNYLASDEIEFLATHRERMSLVYCPRTHAYFGHEPYPLSVMLAAGVRVAIGTDSRASNPDLSLWNELRHIARHHPGVSPEAILRMGTLAGAEALGLAGDYGSITFGKQAGLNVVRLIPSRKLEEGLFASDPQPVEHVLSTKY
jgi:cytosine/adenosine deaminase-related metal-dependent hydrolase